MKLVDHRNSQIKFGAEIFPIDIYESPWVLFHGTTNVFANNIERQGFKWTDDLYSKENIKEVVSIFKSMDWRGFGGDAYNALANFTLTNDFARGNNKPIFFTGEPEMAIGYTNEFRVGGETAGCLKYAIENLQTFLESELERNNYRAWRFNSLTSTFRIPLPPRFAAMIPKKTSAQDCKDLAMHIESVIGRKCVFNELDITRGDQATYQPWDEDLNWLADKLKNLEVILNRLNSITSEYDYGIIYAVEFNKTDVQFMQSLNRSMMHGIACYGPISPDQIRAKALISRDQVRLNTTLNSKASNLRLSQGITGALMATDQI